MKIKKLVSLLLTVSMLATMLTLPANAMHATPPDMSEVPNFVMTFEKISDADGNMEDTSIETGDIFWAVVAIEDISTFATGGCKIAYNPEVVDLCLGNGNVSTVAAGVFPASSREISSITFTDAEGTKTPIDTLLTTITGTETTSDGRKVFGYMWNKSPTVVEYDEAFNEYPVTHVDVPEENNKRIQIGTFRFKVLKMGDPQFEFQADDCKVFLNTDYDSKGIGKGTATGAITGTVAGTTYGGSAPVEAAVPTIDSIVANPTTVTNGGTSTVTVTASTTDEGTLSYELFSNATESNQGGQKVGETNATGEFTVTPANDAATYYYAVVTNTLGESTATATSDVVSVTAEAPAPVITEIKDAQAVAVTAPVGAAAPQTTIADGTGYTGAIQWKSNGSDFTGDTFAYSTTYTAEITLTAKENYKFVTGASINVASADNMGAAVIGSEGKTLTATATFAPTGEQPADPDEAALAAAVASIGSTADLDVAYKADADAKLAAVKTYVDGKLTEGITAKVTLKLGTTYAVALSKGAKTASTELTVTFKEAADPDIALVAAAKTTIERANLKAKQADVTDAATAKAALQAAVNKLNLGGVTATVGDGTYTAPADGKDGSYKATVALSKGEVNDTTTEITLTITATPTVPPVGIVIEVAKKAGETSEKPIAEVGAVKVQDADGQELDPKEITPDTIIRLIAEAKPGFRFFRWVRTVSAAPAAYLAGDELARYSISGTDGDDTVYNVPYVTTTVADAENWTAEFESYAAPAADALTLGNLKVSAPAEAVLTQKTDTQNKGFESGVLEYDLTLLPGSTTVSVQPFMQKGSAYDPATDTVKVNGQDVTLTTVENTDSYTTAAPVAVDVSALEKFTVETYRNNTLNTTYTINVTKLAEMPHIYMDLQPNGNPGDYALKMYAENTYFTTAAVQVKLNGAKADCVIFTDDGYSAELSTGAQTDGTGFTLKDDAVVNVTATYDATTKTYTILAHSKDGKPQTADGKLELATFYIQSAESTEPMNVVMENVKLGTGAEANALGDDRMLGIKHTEENGLVQFIFPDTYKLMGFVNSYYSDAVAAQRITVDVLNNDISQLSELAGLNAIGEFNVELLASPDYVLVVKAPGYKAAETPVALAKDTSVGAIALIAGDMNGDGVIDATDRDLLLQILYKTVDAGEAGDFDGSGVVSGIDLAYLLNGIGK